MRRALVLAASADLPPGPNPRVGCVLLAPDGQAVAEGYHRGAGTPHAEVAALTRAGARAVGATAVVTLEPCNHIGRTGPCVDALVAAGVARVVYAQADPNPRATGGAAGLRAKGVSVEGGLCTAEAAALNPVWTFAVEHGRPFVTWKYAATLDGRVAAADRTSRWITSPEARADVHAQRAHCDVVLVGTGTVLADDPHLTVRSATGALAANQPLRAVMGRREIPIRARVCDDSAETIHLRTRDPAEALTRLHERERRHVWLEGGPTLAAAFVRAGLVDEVVAYLAPALLGAGPAVIGDIGVRTIGAAARLGIADVTRVGPDVRLICRPIRSQEDT